MSEFWAVMWLPKTQETWSLRATSSELAATILRMHEEHPEEEISIVPIP